MKSKYEAIRVLKEIFSEYPIYIQEDETHLTCINEEDIVLDEDDDIVIKNWSKTQDESNSENQM